MLEVRGQRVIPPVTAQAKHAHFSVFQHLVWKRILQVRPIFLNAEVRVQAPTEPTGFWQQPIIVAQMPLQLNTHMGGVQVCPRARSKRHAQPRLTQMGEKKKKTD